MKSNKERLLGCLPQTPPEVSHAVQQAFRQIHQETEAQPPRRYARRLSFGMIALMIVLTMAIGVAAGIRFGVFDFMAQFFDQADLLPQAGELVQNELAIKETARTTISLSQAVYDGGNLRLVYSVRVKGATKPITVDELNDPDSDFRKTLAADGVSAWGCDWFYLDGVEYIMTGGSAIATIPGAENGEALCYLDIYLASAEIVPQTDFKVSLPIIRRDAGERDTLDFAVKATAEAFKPITRRVNGATVTVESAFLSPVRSYVNLRIQIDDGVSTLQGDLLLADWKDAMLTDAQGNELAKCSELQTLAETKGMSAEISYTFLPTDAAEVFIAPMVIGENDHWYTDMTQAIQLKPTLE